MDEKDKDCDICREKSSSVQLMQHNYNNIFYLDMVGFKANIAYGAV